MKTRLIALTGLMGSGKNTVAAMLGGLEISFAEPLKQFCQEVFNFSLDQLNGPSELRNRPDTRHPREHGPWVPASTPCPAGCCSSACACCGARTHQAAWRCYLTPRFALQTLGTEWGRACYADVWAALGVRRALAHLDRNPGALVVITDCRFINEARLVCQAGGEVWRVVRPGQGLSGAAGLHPSETEMASPEMNALVTVTVRNEGTLDDLRSAARRELAALEVR
jgi:hypothetical protein